MHHFCMALALFTSISKHINGKSKKTVSKNDVNDEYLLIL